MLAQTTRRFEAGTEVINGIATIRGFEKIFYNTTVVILSFTAIVFFIVFIIGGIKYLTSGGNKDATESARKTLTYGIGGIVLVAVAYLIIALIADFTGAPIRTFQIWQGP